MNYAIREVREDDLPYLAANLRSADIKELYATYGHLRIPEVVRKCFELSDRSRVGVNDSDKPVVAFGVKRFSPACAVVWAFGTPEIRRYSIPFIRYSRPVLQDWFEELPDIQYFLNFSHSENTLHHRWLAWVGAELLPDAPWGETGELFRPFIIRRQPSATSD